MNFVKNSPTSAGSREVGENVRIETDNSKAFMKVGFVQFAPTLGDIQKTMSRINCLSNQFSGIDLVVLPELSNSGYNFESRQHAWDCSETVLDSILLRRLSKICAKRNCHIVTGLSEREGDRLYNSSILAGPNGVVGIYRKLHLFQNEKDFFAPGDMGLPVFDIGTVKIGMLICFDWRFPEVWRILALKGADIICHPSNLVIPDLAQRAVPVHALLNRVYTITANRIGKERELTFTGRSIICNTAGEIVASASKDEECVRTIEIDIAAARNKDSNSRNNLFADRRPEEYQFLCESQTVRR